METNRKSVPNTEAMQEDTQGEAIQANDGGSMPTGATGANDGAGNSPESPQNSPKEAPLEPKEGGKGSTTGETQGEDEETLKSLSAKLESLAKALREERESRKANEKEKKALSANLEVMEQERIARLAVEERTQKDRYLFENVLSSMDTVSGDVGQRKDGGIVNLKTFDRLSQLIRLENPDRPLDEVFAEAQELATIQKSYLEQREIALLRAQASKQQFTPKQPESAEKDPRNTLLQPNAWRM